MNAGFLVMDKPPGLTSHDVVAIVRAVTGLPKVGHTGTLDPFASGVLVLALGGATRLIQYLDERLKVYDATIALGAATTTGDPEGEVIRSGPTEPSGDVEAALQGFVGPRMQRPPAYSAVKVKGRPLYRYAREGREVEVEARPIEIYAMTLLERGRGTLRVEIRCSRGTYARVLADEVAVALGTSGHLSALRRLQSGPFRLETALPLSELARVVAGVADWEQAFRTRGSERLPWAPREEVAAALAPRVVTVEAAVAHLPALPVPPARRAHLLSGSWAPRDAEGPPGLVRITCGEELLAIGEVGEGGAVRIRIGRDGPRQP